MKHLVVGRVAEVHFNPVSKTAFKIIEMPDGHIAGKKREGSRTEGKIAEFKDGKLKIYTDGGVPTVILVDSSTNIVLSDNSPGTLENLKTDNNMKAYFSPITNIAFEIELQEP
jgi:hypothetical protein